MRYTQKQFDAFPIVDGMRQCPSGDYGDIRNFGASCSFGERSSFGAGCSFGNGCMFEGGHKALPGYPLMSLAGCGSMNRTVYAFNVESGPIIRAGCFVGTLSEFRSKVRADGDRLKSLQYLGFANIVAATWCPERIEK